MVIPQSFNGAGDTLPPTLINLVCFWLWELPLAYWLARRAGLGPQGVALAVTGAVSTVGGRGGVDLPGGPREGPGGVGGPGGGRGPAAPRTARPVAARGGGRAPPL